MRSSRRPLALCVPALLLAVAAACRTRDPAADARRSAQARYEGRTLEEWWPLRRDPSPETSYEARTAMRTLGAAAVPFLADKAAGHDLGDVIGASVALEDQCPGALPALEAARSEYPSAALEQAIRRVRASTSDTGHVTLCGGGGAPARAAPRQ